MHRSNWVLLLVVLAASVFLTAVAPQAGAQGIRDRSQKKAVRGMTGDFDGVGMVFWVTHEEARRLLPNPSLQLDYPGDARLHPVVLLLGAEHNVGVQLRRSYVHPRFLKHYDNAYVIVPYLRHPATSQHVYVFSKIFVSDDKVTERGSKLNGSPKVHASIEDAAGRFVVDYQGERRIDLSMREYQPTAQHQSPVAAARQPHPASATAALLRTIFRQPKIEFSPHVHLFAFDFMAEAKALTPAIITGTVRVPAVAGDSAGHRASDVVLLTPNYSVQAIRFSSHWVKTLQH